MKHPIRKALFKSTLFILLFSLLPLTSCGKYPEKEYTPEEIVESIDNALHSIETDVEEIPAEEMDWGEAEEMKPVDNPDETSSIIYLDDIKLKEAENEISIVDARYKNTPTPFENPSDILPGPEHLHLYDENRQDLPLRRIRTTAGKGQIALPIEDMWRGHLYHLDLLDENLCFAHKSPNIRSLSLIFEEYAPKSALTDQEQQIPDIPTNRTIIIG